MRVFDDGQVAHTDPKDALARRKSLLRAWLCSYEIYIIIILAAFLRFYGIQTTEFDGDQADIFRMARDAVMHGHLVATSNMASIGMYNPPGIVYVLMIPAAFSVNPIGGVIETAVLAVLGVGLTYWFTRRYYGRVAATIAASLFAVCSVPLFYSRFMWNQNLLLFFVPLFLCVIFRGVVDRKPGWLFPAVFLYGLLFQWHGSSLLLMAPLFVAVLLAPGTLRWRDFLFGILSLIILYAPYIIWLVATKLAVLSLLSQTGSIPSFIDGQSWLFYLHLISPYDLPLTNRLALLYNWQHFFNWLVLAMACLVIAAALFALRSVLVGARRRAESHASHVFRDWWQKILDLRASPYRCGLLVLLVWQIFPLLMLTRHAYLYSHYFIFLMPGPFILIGWFIAKVASWFRARKGWQRRVSMAIYVYVGLLVILQGIAGVASVIDRSHGNFDDRQMSSPYYNDLASVQSAVTKAGQLAQQYHAERLLVFASTSAYSRAQMLRCVQAPKDVVCQNSNWYDSSMRSVFRYFTDQLKISSAIVDDTCFLLPGPTTGRMVVLVSPYEPEIDAFFAGNYMHVVQSTISKRLGGEPFHLYVVEPLPEATPHMTFSSTIQLVSAQTEQLQVTTQQGVQNKSLTVVRWNLLRADPASDRVNYLYKFTYTGPKNGAHLSSHTCILTNSRAGEQLVMLLPYENVQDSLSVQVELASTRPYTIMLKPLPFLPAFDTFKQDVTEFKRLRVGE